MKNTTIAALALVITSIFWLSMRHARKAREESKQAHQESLAGLEERSLDLQVFLREARTRLTGIQEELKARAAAARTNLAADRSTFNSEFPPADPSRNGGWFPNNGFFYFPKSLLSNVTCQVINGYQVTDDAAALLGMTPSEHQSLNKALENLVGSFRKLEADKMKPVSPPASWGAGGVVSFESALVYSIPDLSPDTASLRDAFASRVQAALGPERAPLFEQMAGREIDERLQNLGTGDRTVGFLWQSEADGTKSLWFGTASARAGEGSFQRVPEDVDPHSEIAHYAGLFGVTLPQSAK